MYRSHRLPTLSAHTLRRLRHALPKNPRYSAACLLIRANAKYLGHIAVCSADRYISKSLRHIAVCSADRSNSRSLPHVAACLVPGWPPTRNIVGHVVACLGGRYHGPDTRRGLGVSGANRPRSLGRPHARDPWPTYQRRPCGLTLQLNCRACSHRDLALADYPRDSIAGLTPHHRLAPRHIDHYEKSRNATRSPAISPHEGHQPRAQPGCAGMIR
jgi:hypothetical protein